MHLSIYRISLRRLIFSHHFRDLMALVESLILLIIQQVLKQQLIICFIPIKIFSHIV